MLKLNPRDTFNQRLQSCATLIEARLEDWLTYVTDDAQPPERLAAAMRHGALGGGKRLRPFLIIECAALFGVTPEAALNAGAALECVHCYSLIHDDLPAMDDDDLRRGRPTVHKAFNEATAILAGDSLLTLAFEIMAAPDTHPDASVRAELVLCLARASGWCGMAGGQQLDLDAETARAPLGEGDIRRLQAMKTGALITFACEAGAMLGGARPPHRAALKRYGDFLGRAFQLADDILDLEGDAAVVGKATAKDQQAGKATLVSLMGIEAARLRLDALVAEAKQALEPFGGRASILVHAADFVAARKS
ncbi:MAG: polyprenyl synthetase family protein [Chitinophagales bacterium]|nr:polyprenyl synthetase family protein [Hyphomicrobiales bacterium]